MPPPLDARSCLGAHDVLFVTLDSLRYDVAAEALIRGETPNLAGILPGGAWEKRHSPSTFTYGAHCAFFAGFLPTPGGPKGAAAQRLFATRFPGSRSTGRHTMVFEEGDIVSGFAAHGYRTICIGGVGFFNKRSQLGSTLPALFHESWWAPRLGVTGKHSTEHQVRLACERIAQCPDDQRLFLFLNVSACHAPNRIFVEGATCDGADTQRAALTYVDRCLPPLFRAMTARAPVLTVICSDHGEAYGEDGYHGHRLAHPTVWEVPYLETILPRVE